MELLKTTQESSLASQMNVNQDKLDKMDASQREMKAMMETDQGEMKSIAENQEVCNEEATVEIIRATEGRTGAVPILHGVRAAITKDRRSRKDDGRARNATVE
jgi:hypothetical protein